MKQNGDDTHTDCRHAGACLRVRSARELNKEMGSRSPVLARKRLQVSGSKMKCLDGG